MTLAEVQTTEEETGHESGRCVRTEEGRGGRAGFRFVAGAIPPGSQDLGVKVGTPVRSGGLV